jgi:hypothetical protein
VPFLAGSEVDFVDDLIGASFRVVNPNATASRLRNEFLDLTPAITAAASLTFTFYMREAAAREINRGLQVCSVGCDGRIRPVFEKINGKISGRIVRQIKRPCARRCRIWVQALPACADVS